MVNQQPGAPSTSNDGGEHHGEDRINSTDLTMEGLAAPVTRVSSHGERVENSKSMAPSKLKENEKNKKSTKLSGADDDDKNSIVASETSSTQSPTPSLSKEELAIRAALLSRSYHLPGNSYYQDLFQYITINHPLFGICFQHPLHPVGRGLRFAAFVGSIVFGLATTNIIYLAFVMEDKDFDQSFAKLSFSNSTTGQEELDVLIDQFTQVDVTAGIITLWTVGSALNAIFDNVIWYVSACAWCLPGGRFQHLEKYRKYTPYLVMFLVVGATAIATLAVLIVAASEANRETEEVAGSVGLQFNSDAESYRFLLAYTVELALSLFVYYPLIGFLFFSGYLNCCGKMPSLGGRPQQMRMLEEREQSLETADTMEAREDFV